MGEDLLNGLMGKVIMENIWRIKNMEKGYLQWLMGKNTSGNGKWANSMELDCKLLKEWKGKLECGRRGKKLGG